MEYIPIIVSVIAVLVTLYSLFHKENRDKEQHTASSEIDTQVAIAKLDVKLGIILDTMNEMKETQRKQDDRIDLLAERVSKLENAIKHGGV